MIKPIELLAPAKNYEYGVAAINAGADAVYIGAPRFGARYGATNSIEDISNLITYAHQFGVKVFVTLNTVLLDNELEEAKKIAKELEYIGVDALIVQDMAYLMFDLKIPLHASTQAAALTSEKVLFYQNAGFERVILERAMSIDDFKTIRAETSVELEAFVHGAICVSYSGQCYMGQVVSGRSGNRGVCSQPCRSTFNLINEKEEVLIKNRHLLSLLDLNLSDYIPQIIDAGITSLKIEGRVKDISYLKNIVAHYRKTIDKNSNILRSSVGYSIIPFDPNPIKTFSRRYTSYFIDGTKVGKSYSSLASFNTAKAVGEEVGVVVATTKDSFKIKTSLDFNGGDGICFIDKFGNFGGTNINSSRRMGSEVSLSPNVIDGISVGTMIYRNSDKKYIDEITTAKISRKINASIKITFNEEGAIYATITDSTGEVASWGDGKELDFAKDIDKTITTIKTQFAKSGDTIFNITDVEVDGTPRFLAISLINKIRRELIDKLTSVRLTNYKSDRNFKLSFPKPYSEKIDYKANITNHLSRQFYEKCGFQVVGEGVESNKGDYSDIETMTTRYCIRREIGQCVKDGGAHKKLFLENNGNRFELSFDCINCRMKIIYKGKI